MKRNPMMQRVWDIEGGSSLDMLIDRLAMGIAYACNASSEEDELAGHRDEEAARAAIRKASQEIQRELHRIGGCEGGEGISHTPACRFFNCQT